MQDIIAQKYSCIYFMSIPTIIPFYIENWDLTLKISLRTMNILHWKVKNKTSSLWIMLQVQSNVINVLIIVASYSYDTREIACYGGGDQSFRFNINITPCINIMVPRAAKLMKLLSPFSLMVLPPTPAYAYFK